MGNDGGSIPKRSELVKSAARLPTSSELKATAFESLSHAWETDPVTSEPLDLDNAVSDWRGHLYNYESILKGLMPGNDPDAVNENGENREAAFASTGIKSLRDVVKLKFKRYSPTGSNEKPVWACPLSLKELGPGAKSVYLVPCGHAFAEVAIREIQDLLCPECSEAFNKENIIPILPTEKSELERLRRRMEGLRTEGLLHSLKKDKANGKKKRKAGGKGSDEVLEDPPKAKERVAKSDAASRVSGLNNAVAPSLTAKVLAEQEERSKRQKIAAR